MNGKILGLDIGGANLKASTTERAISLPFALWKQPGELATYLAKLVERFPGTTSFAVTMTGELCDCFETKADGVNLILDATTQITSGRPVRIWSTDGVFVEIEEARTNYLKVAASNWHALATFAGRFAPDTTAILIDIGSTTSDLIPLHNGRPAIAALTDRARLEAYNLVYKGVRRTPLFAIDPDSICAEFFATTQDLFVVLGMLPEDPTDTDTANGRPLTVDQSLTRLSRVLGADRTELSDDLIIAFAESMAVKMIAGLAVNVKMAYRRSLGERPVQSVILSGAGEFLARRVVEQAFPEVKKIISLNEQLDPTISSAAPAYALAVLAGEKQRDTLSSSQNPLQ